MPLIQNAIKEIPPLDLDLEPVTIGYNFSVDITTEPVLQYENNDFSTLQSQLDSPVDDQPNEIESAANQLVKLVGGQTTRIKVILICGE